MFKKILCGLGFHKWAKDLRFGEESSRELCVRCGQQRLTVNVIMESELQKMMERGELSFTGYSKAVARGYLKKSDFDEEDDITFC